MSLFELACDCDKDTTFDGVGLSGLGYLGASAAAQAAAAAKKQAAAEAAAAKKQAAADAAAAKKAAAAAKTAAVQAAKALPAAQKQAAIKTANQTAAAAVKQISQAKASEVKSIAADQKHEVATINATKATAVVAEKAQAKADTAAKKAATQALQTAKKDEKKAVAAQKKADKLAKKVGGKDVKIDAKDNAAVDAIAAAVEAAKKKTEELKAQLAALKAKKKAPGGMKGLSGLAARVHNDAKRRAKIEARAGNRPAFIKHARKAAQAMSLLRGLHSAARGLSGLGDDTTGTNPLKDMMDQQLAQAIADKNVACAKRPNAPKCLYATMSADSKQQMAFMMTLLDQINSNNEILMQQILDAIASLQNQNCTGYDANGQCISSGGGVIQGPVYDPNSGMYVDPTTGQPVNATTQIDPATGLPVQQPSQYYADSGMMTSGDAGMMPSSEAYSGGYSAGAGGGFDPNSGGFIDTAGTYASGGIIPMDEGMTYSPMPGAEISSEMYDGGTTPDDAAQGDSMYSSGGLEYEAEPTADGGAEMVAYDQQAQPRRRQPVTQSMVTADDYDQILDDEMVADGGGDGFDTAENSGGDDFGMSGMGVDDPNPEVQKIEYGPDGLMRPAGSGGSTAASIFQGVTNVLQTGANVATQYQMNQAALKAQRQRQSSSIMMPLLILGGLALGGAVLLKSRKK